MYYSEDVSRFSEVQSCHKITYGVFWAKYGSAEYNHDEWMALADLRLKLEDAHPRVFAAVIASLKKLEQEGKAYLTGSRKILGKTDRDWDWMKTSKKRHGVPAGGWGNYLDPCVDEVWSIKLGDYNKKVDLQICNNEWHFAEKCRVTSFLTSCDSDEVELVFQHIGGRVVWLELLFAAYDDGGPEQVWSDMVKRSAEMLHKEWAN